MESCHPELLRKVQSDDSLDVATITDSTAMMRAEKWLAQAYCVLVLTCRGKVLQVVQQVPRGFGFEGWRQLHEEFEPHPTVKSQEMCQALLSPTKSDESVQMVRQQGNGLKVCEECRSCSQEHPRPGISPPRKWLIRAGRMCETSESTDPQTWHGEEEDDESVKLKKYFSRW